MITTLFIKMNSREYTVIDSKNFGKMIQMEVGAMMVGKIVNYNHQIASKGKEKRLILNLVDQQLS